MSDFLVGVFGVGLAMLAFALIALVNSLRFGSALWRYPWVAEVVEGADAHGNLYVTHANGSPAVLCLRVLPWRRARFASAGTVWVAAPERGAGVLAVDGGRDLAWFRRVAQKTDHSHTTVETPHSAPGRPKSRTAPSAARRATAHRLGPEPRPISGSVVASGCGVDRNTVEPAAVTDAPIGTSNWPLVGARAFVFGVAAAVPVAAAIAAVVAWTGWVGGGLSVALGGCVGYAVAVGGGPLPVGVRRLIAVLATALGVAVWVYLLIRQDFGITRAPLLLPGTTLAGAVSQEVRGDGWSVLFWLLALVAAWTVAASPTVPHGAVSAEPGSVLGGARLHAGRIRSMIWLVVAASLFVGLAASYVLARTQVESGTADPPAHLVAGSSGGSGTGSSSTRPRGREWVLAPAPAGYVPGPPIGVDGPMNASAFNTYMADTGAAASFRFVDGYEWTYDCDTCDDMVDVALVELGSAAESAQLIDELTTLLPGERMSHPRSIPSALEVDELHADDGSYEHDIVAAKGADVMIIDGWVASPRLPTALRQLAERQYAALKP